MEKKHERAIWIIGMLLLCLFGGFGWFRNIDCFNKTSKVVITSLRNGEKVHSVVPIDGTGKDYNFVEVLVNGAVKSKVLPYYWNNMRYPVGTYNITVRAAVINGNETTYIQDSKYVVIPENFTLNALYQFTEAFVVHRGQTVYIENQNIFIGVSDYSNGPSPIDEYTYWDVNVFGNLILVNSTITARSFMIEDNGSIFFHNSSILNTPQRLLIETPNGEQIFMDPIRVDDFASMIFDTSGYTTYHIIYDEFGMTFVTIINALDSSMNMLICENATCNLL